MRCLPELGRPELGELPPWGQLPLPDATAVALEAMLLSADTVEMRALAAGALALDPALALWAACRSTRNSPTSPATVDELAAWLPPRVAVLLDEASSDGGAFSVDSDDGEAASRDVDEASRLAARCVALAELARQFARLAEDGTAEAGYLLGLLYGGQRWIILPRNRQGEAESSAALPDCLREFLAAVDGKNLPPDSPHKHVLQALAALGDGDVLDEAAATGLPPDALTAVNARREAALAHWQTSDSEVWRRLPGVVHLAAKYQRLQAQYQSELEREKLEAVKELAYGAGHEINNPLANISARAQALLKEVTHPEHRRMLAAINSQTFRAHEMIADLMLFSRPPKLDPQPCDVSAIVAEVAAQLMEEVQKRGMQLEWALPEVPVIVEADTVHLAVALRAIGRNSLEALPAGGRLRWEVRTAGEAAEIALGDDGPGITADVRRHLFDPFYSGREAGRGLGFGLSKCWRIVTDHGGQIIVDSEPGRGATFTIRLPLASEPVTVESAVSAAAAKR
ncbi:MAG: HAMP domain-containing sensor histidine kinase [Pirellulales bacterium]